MQTSIGLSYSAIKSLYCKNAIHVHLGLANSVDHEKLSEKNKRKVSKSRSRNSQISRILFCCFTIFVDVASKCIMEIMMSIAFGA